MNEENKELGVGMVRPDGVAERSQSLCTYAKQKQYKSADYHVTDSDYGDMIIEMVGKMRNEDYLEKIYYYVRAKYRRDSEKTGD